MARTSYIQKDGKLIRKDEYYGTDRPSLPYIQGDYQPYQSMATGEYVEGRKAHREHLKRHGLVEAADLPMKNPEAPRTDPRLKEQIARQVYNKLRY